MNPKNNLGRRRLFNARNLFVFTILLAALFMPIKPVEAAADTWQYALNRAWEVDPIFQWASQWNGRYHLGEDVEAPAGTPVYALAEGTVKFTGNFPSYQNWGGLILIEHKEPSGAKSVAAYGHLKANDFKVGAGDTVDRGQLIGYIANRDNNGGWKEHIHLGIRPGGYVSSPWVYWGLYTKSELNNWVRPSEFITARGIYKPIRRVPNLTQNRYDTAVGVSQARFDSDEASAVILASGENFPDALSATALTLEENAALLLTRRTTIPGNVLQEIDRVVPNGSKIFVAGGEAAVSSSALAQLPSHYQIERLAGANAEATAVEIAKKVPSTDKVFIANSRRFADGVSSGVATATNRIPLLLTRDGSLSPETKSYLLANPSLEKVEIIGGPAAVPVKVADEIAALPTVKSVQRIEGADRYETARKMMEKYVTDPKYVFVATGENFPDSLTGSSLAAQVGGALLLSSFNKIKGGGLDYARNHNDTIVDGRILGGTAALSQLVEISLGSVLTKTPFTTASIEQAKQKIKNLSDGLYKSEYRGAQIYQSSPTTTDETYSELVITELEIGSDTIPVQMLENWMGLNTGHLSTGETLTNGLTIIDNFISMLPTTAAFYVKDNKLYLIEIHKEPHEARSDLENFKI